MADEKPAAKPTITANENGPLIVRRLQRLRNSKGEALQTNAVVALCRCGGSANKPFCDGSHKRVGFKSAHTADKSQDRTETYTGKDVTILDNRFICAHIGACSDGLAEVFLYGKEPWIDPDGAPSEQVCEVIRRCPSGALAYALGGKTERDYDREPGITVSKNGPYYVVGGIELASDAWGKEASREHYALCRCGKSKRKPFCDGAHWDGFTDEKN